MSRLSRALAKLCRRTWMWRALWRHNQVVAFVDPAAGATNARCWATPGSNLRAVYDQVTACKGQLLPLVTGIYLKRRRVVYASLFGEVEVYTRPREGVPPTSAAWTAVWTGTQLRFASPPGPWTRAAWWLERRLFRGVQFVNDAVVLGARRRHKHSTRSAASQMLYRLH